MPLAIKIIILPIDIKIYGGLMGNYVIHSPEILGKLIKTKRKERKLNQSELSQLTGLNQTTISRAEVNPRKIHLATLFIILNALEIRIMVDDSSNVSTNVGEW